METTSLCAAHNMLAEVQLKLCSHNSKCATYSPGKHPRTFKGKLQLPIQVKHKIFEALLIDVLAYAKAFF